MDRRRHGNPTCLSFTSATACFPWQRHLHKTPQRSVTPPRKIFAKLLFPWKPEEKLSPAGLFFFLIPKSSPLVNVNTEKNKSNKNAQSDKEQLTEAAIRSPISTQQMTGKHSYPTLFSKTDSFNQRMWKMMSRVVVGMTKWVLKAEETLRRQQFSTSSFITSREEKPAAALCREPQRGRVRSMLSSRSGPVVLPELCRRGEVDWTSARLVNVHLAGTEIQILPCSCCSLQMSQQWDANASFNAVCPTGDLQHASIGGTTQAVMWGASWWHKINSFPSKCNIKCNHQLPAASKHCFCLQSETQNISH